MNIFVKFIQVAARHKKLNTCNLLKDKMMAFNDYSRIYIAFRVCVIIGWAFLILICIDIDKDTHENSLIANFSFRG